jgi:hypothetical protein
VILGKGFKILHHLFPGLGRRDHIKDVVASGTANLDSLLRDTRIVQIKFGETGSAGDNHRKPLFPRFLAIMEKGMKKIKNKITDPPFFVKKNRKKFAIQTLQRFLFGGKRPVRSWKASKLWGGG